MTTTPVPILFISGAGLPPWVWDGVGRQLSDARLAGTAARATAVAARPHEPEPGLEDYARAAIESAPPGEFAVVAHSAGGVVAAEVARLAPARVTALLAICAVIAPPGGSFISAMPAPNRWVMSAVLRMAGTRPPDSSIRGTLAFGVDTSVANRLVADFTRESLAYYRDRAGVTAWQCPRGYVHAEHDRELPAAWQRRFAQRLGGDWDESIATGHLPMLEAPGELAGMINRFLDASGGGTRS